MDRQTLDYYARFAREATERYEGAGSGSRIDRFFQTAFTAGQRILDIGAGSGRDLALLLDLGCDAYGVEPCEEMRSQALEHHPQLAGRISPGALPGLGQPFGGRFDGVLCSAVLQHLPGEAILDAALAIKNTLQPNGRLLLGIPRERPDLDAQFRDEHGRLYAPLSTEYVESFLSQLGFQLIDRWVSGDSLGRPGHSWWILLFQLG